jgi:hypothetical protein
MWSRVQILARTTGPTRMLRTVCMAANTVLVGRYYCTVQQLGKLKSAGSGGHLPRMSGDTQGYSGADDGGPTYPTYPTDCGEFPHGLWWYGVQRDDRPITILGLVVHTLSNSGKWDGYIPYE